MFIEILKAILFGIVEGITEWLPVSSAGHLILLDEFVKLKVSAEFFEMFQVVIQLGAILAVIVLFFRKLMLDTEQFISVGKKTVQGIPPGFRFFLLRPAFKLAAEAVVGAEIALTSAIRQSYESRGKPLHEIAVVRHGDDRTGERQKRIFKCLS